MHGIENLQQLRTGRIRDFQEMTEFCEGAYRCQAPIFNRCWALRCKNPACHSSTPPATTRSPGCTTPPKEGKSPMTQNSIRSRSAGRYTLPAFFAILLCANLISAARAQPATKPAPPADVLVLSDGDTLHGKFVNVIGGKVTFHTDSLGDVTLTWDKIKELHTNGTFGVLKQSVTGKGQPGHRQSANRNGGCRQRVSHLTC